MKLGSVLKKIIQDKKKLIEEKKGILTLEELIAVSYTHLTLPTTPYV